MRAIAKRVSAEITHGKKSKTMERWGANYEIQGGRSRKRRKSKRSGMGKREVLGSTIAWRVTVHKQQDGQKSPTCPWKWRPSRSVSGVDASTHIKKSNSRGIKKQFEKTRTSLPKEVNQPLA